MKNKKIFKLSLLSSVLLGISCLTSAQPIGYAGLSYPIVSSEGNKNIVNQEDLMSSQLDAKNIKNKEDVSEIRKEAIKEVAGSLGASSGLNYRMNELRKEVNFKSIDLDKIYDFSQMTIDNGVLAPVLTEGLSNYAQNSEDQVRIADKMYKIEQSAKFVSVYPTWRTYLRFTFPTFEIPNSSYLPKNETEKAIWDLAVKEGWLKGINQANKIFESSYAKLERDYLGMVKYKILLAEGLITPTIIAKQNLGVTGGGKNLSINDQIFRITDHSALNPNKKDWKVEYPVTNQTNGKLN